MVVITLEHQKRRRTRDTDLAGMSWNEGDETINRSFQLQANGRSVSAVSEFFGPISFDVCTASLGSGPQPGILLTHPRCGLRAAVEMLSPAIPGRTDGKDVTGRHSTAVWVGLAQPVEGLEAKTEAPGDPRLSALTRRSRLKTLACSACTPACQPARPSSDVPAATTLRASPRMNYNTAMSDFTVHSIANTVCASPHAPTRSCWIFFG